MNPTELYKLSSEDIRKIFPENYYTKYASHLKILQFEKLTIEEEKKRNHLKFQMRRTQHSQPIPALPPKVPISTYDNYEDTIDKNKEELKRLAKYKLALDTKLKLTPSPKKNTIRSPTKLDHKIDDRVLLRLKAIDDMEYEEELKLMEKVKEKKDKQSQCKFVHKGRSATTSPNKNNPEAAYNTHTEESQIHLSLGSGENLMPHRKLFVSQFSQRSLSYGTMKKSKGSLRKNESRMMQSSSRQMSTNIERQQKRDLVAETKAIREQVSSMKLLKRYDELIRARNHQQSLIELE